MKNLLLNIIPLTILSVFLISKYWYVQVIDWTDEFMVGFPLIFTCRGFHTSLSSQFFIFEFIVDFIVYYFLIFFIAYLTKRYLVNFSISKFFYRIYWSLFMITCCLFFAISYISTDFYQLKRDFEVEEIDRGFSLLLTQDKENKIREAYLKKRLPSN